MLINGNIKKVKKLIQINKEFSEKCEFKNENCAKYQTFPKAWTSFITSELHIIEVFFILIEYNYKYAPNTSEGYHIYPHFVVININYVCIYN